MDPGAYGNGYRFGRFATSLGFEISSTCFRMGFQLGLETVSNFGTCHEPLRLYSSLSSSLREPISNMINKRGNERLLTEVEVAIIVGDALRKVEIPLAALAVFVTERSTENRNLTATLDGEMDVFSGVGEVLAVPAEASFP